MNLGENRGFGSPPRHAKTQEHGAAEKQHAYKVGAPGPGRGQSFQPAHPSFERRRILAGLHVAHPPNVSRLSGGGKPGSCVLARRPTATAENSSPTRDCASPSIRVAAFFLEAQDVLTNPNLDVLDEIPLIPPGRISILLLKNPRPDEEPHLTRLALRRLTEDDVPHLGTATLQSITWSTVSGFKGLENDVIIVAGLTDIESDWHRGVAYVGMSRARTWQRIPIGRTCGPRRPNSEVEGVYSLNETGLLAQRELSTFAVSRR